MCHPRSMKHPQAKLLKAGSTIGLPFDQFQSMDLSLGLPVTVRGLKRAIDRVVIAIDACCQTTEFGDVTLLGFFEPSRQDSYLSLGDHGPKILCQKIRSSQFFIFDA